MVCAAEVLRPAEKLESGKVVAAADCHSDFIVAASFRGVFIHVLQNGDETKGTAVISERSGAVTVRIGLILVAAVCAAETGFNVELQSVYDGRFVKQCIVDREADERHGIQSPCAVTVPAGAERAGALTEDLEARGCGSRTHRAEASHPKLAVLLVSKVKERAEVKEDVLFLKLSRIGSKTGFCNETHGKLIADVLVSTDGEAAGVQHA